MTAPGRPYADAEARERAAGDLESSFVVMAGAGTGKTSLLVERVLVAVSLGHAPLERIAAITFTEKAAGEMRDRLGERLETLRAIAAGEADDRDASAKKTEAHRAFDRLVGTRGVAPDVVAGRALAALEALDRATISTIHGFCAQLLRERPIEARVEPGFEIDRGERFEAAFDEEWERWLAAELGPSATRPDLWMSVLREHSLQVVREAARALSGHGVPRRFVDAPYEPSDARGILSDPVEALRAGIDAFLALVAERLSATPRDYLAAANEVLRVFTESGRDAALEAARRFKSLDRKAPPAPNTKLSDGEQRLYREWAGRAFRLLRDLSRVDEASCARLVDAVRPFARGMRDAIRRQGLIGFDGLLVLARDLLRDNPDVRETIRGRYDTILVDEFQDTDPVQYEIVLFLAEASGGRAVDAFEASLAPGRLFIVGDAKQSIYRFRGADYDAFGRAVDRVTTSREHRLDLVTSFRSVPGVVAAINALFEGPGSSWLPSSHQPEYVPIDSARAAASDEPAVELWTIDDTTGLAADERRLAEGRVLARGILDHVERGGRPGDVLVLLRAFTAIGRYLGPLRDAGIRFFVSSGKTFFDRPEVGHFMAILRVLANPSDPVAVLAYLRSPAGGVPDEELLTHAEAGGTFGAADRTASAATPTLARALERLVALREETRRIPADALVRRVLERSDLRTLEATTWEGAQRVANLDLLAARAAGLARDGRLPLSRILDVLEDDSAAIVEGDSSIADEAGDAVRIMTIHGAKGLEAPLVFLPDLAREARGRRGGADTLRAVRVEGRERLAIRSGERLGAAAIRAALDDQAHDEAETLRLLYVAATRARDRLVLLSPRATKTPDARAMPWLAALSAWGYDPASPPSDGEAIAAGRVAHRFVLTPKRGEIAGTAAGAGAAPPTPSWDDAAFAVRAGVERERLVSPSGFGEPHPERKVASSDRALARAVGTAVHRWLECFDPAHPSIDAIDALARASARDAGSDPAAVEREARAIVERFVASPLADRLARVEVLARELPFVAAREGGGIARGSIDLLFRDEDGDVVVADYKTDADEEGLVERYRLQLVEYARAVRSALSLARLPRAELWLVRSGRVLPVPTER